MAQLAELLLEREVIFTEDWKTSRQTSGQQSPSRRGRKRRTEARRAYRHAARRRGEETSIPEEAAPAFATAAPVTANHPRHIRPAWLNRLSGNVRSAAWLLVVVVVEMTVISPLTFWLLWSVIGGWCLGEYWSLLSRRGASLWTGNDKKASSAPVRKVAWYGLGGLYILTAIGTVFSMQEDPMLVVT